MIENKLILRDDFGFSINLDILNKKNKIDLAKKINFKEPENCPEIDFCKEELIDCHLVKIVKKQSVSYGKYIYLLRTALKDMFIPNDKMIQSRINRMLKLEYISFTDEKYHYIP